MVIDLTNSIQKIGRLLSIDQEGYVVNECSWEVIQSPWRDLVMAIANLCQQHLGDRLHSLYLRGSVPRGQAIAKVSDIDAIAIIDGDITADLVDLTTSLESQLEKQYLFCSKVELDPVSLAKVQADVHWQMLLQTQGLCIYGEDLRSQFPKFKPDQTMISHAPQLKEDLAEVQQLLRSLVPTQSNYEAIVRQNCSWICKRIVRSGFELIMPTDHSFTRDLYPCYERFSHYFPAQSHLMYKALELAIHPSSNRNGLLMFLSHFGTWLGQQIENELT